eukprot:SAG31_NODE_15750_length_740_cov_1.165367_1_plen_190_part_10
MQLAKIAADKAREAAAEAAYKVEQERLAAERAAEAARREKEERQAAERSAAEEKDRQATERAAAEEKERQAAEAEAEANRKAAKAAKEAPALSGKTSEPEVEAALPSRDFIPGTQPGTVLPEPVLEPPIQLAPTSPAEVVIDHPPQTTEYQKELRSQNGLSPPSMIRGSSEFAPAESYIREPAAGVTAPS